VIDGAPTRAVTSSLQLIGGTPLVRVGCFDTHGSELWLKVESANPGGSIKDRIGLAMIQAAEAAGALTPGQPGHLVEATAGNTGLGLALVAAIRGYRLTLVIPDKMSQEKVAHLRALGAKVVMTRSDVCKGHPDYYQDLAQRIAAAEGAYHVNQFENPANPLAHERGTAPEIWQQAAHRVDAVVCGVGSGGTITGMSRFFERVSPRTEIVLADPEGSVLAGYVANGTIGTAGSWLVEGIGEDFLPPICDLSRVKTAYTIGDGEAFAIVRRLLAAEGIFAGTSTGVLVAAALRHCAERPSPGRIVTFVCDSGNKYLSKAYSDQWLSDHGLIERPVVGDLRDLIARRADQGAVVAVAPDEPLSLAYSRMRLYDVSQLPVLDGETLVGIVDESDLLLAVMEDGQGFARTVRDVMSRQVQTLPPSAPVSALLPVFAAGMVGVVVDGDRFAGLITRIDLLNHLRRRVSG
jgi:cystathionine beta-synthase